MSESKHTPGPWKAKDNYIYAPIPDEDDIFAISIAVACAGVAPAISNANLIAAAPDMYEALEEVWRILDSTMPLSRDNRADRIKRILCKARGEENERA